jgi:hypothetical protein
MDMVPGHISTRYYHPLETWRGMVDTKQSPQQAGIQNGILRIWGHPRLLFFL